MVGHGSVPPEGLGGPPGVGVKGRHSEPSLRPMCRPQAMYKVKLGAEVHHKMKCCPRSTSIRPNMGLKRSYHIGISYQIHINILNNICAKHNYQILL